MILNSFLSCFTAMNFVFNMKATACPTAAATINSTWREGTNEDMAPIFIDDAVGGACCDIVADGGRRRRGTDYRGFDVSPSYHLEIFLRPP